MPGISEEQHREMHEQFDRAVLGEFTEFDMKALINQFYEMVDTASLVADDDSNIFLEAVKAIANGDDMPLLTRAWAILSGSLIKQGIGVPVLVMGLGITERIIETMKEEGVFDGDGD